MEAGAGFEDLQPLKQIIGDARIVALGEGTHGTREFFQMKHRLVEFLASEMGFTVFSIEANMPEAYRVDDFVSKGEGDPERLISGMYFWTWHTEEVADMVRWMRGFNQTGKGHVRFTGFDMQTPDVAARIAEEYLKRVDPEYAKTAAGTFATISKASPSQSGAAFGVASGAFPVEAARGKKVALEGVDPHRRSPRRVRRSVVPRRRGGRGHARFRQHVRTRRLGNYRLGRILARGLGSPGRGEHRLRGAHAGARHGVV